MSNFSDLISSAFLHYRVGRQHSNNHSVTYYRYPELDCSSKDISELPECDPDHIRIVIVSDTHNRHKCMDFLPPSDILFHCGDILMTGRILSPEAQLKIMGSFDRWMGRTPAKQRYFVAGNHDHVLCHHIQDKQERKAVFSNAEYLENDFLRLENGLTVFATPVSVGASGNRAFQSAEFLQQTIREATLASEQVSNAQVDFLVTHGFGSGISHLINHNLHICGHYHEMYGMAVISVLDEYDDGTWRERKLKSKHYHDHHDTYSATSHRPRLTGRTVAKQVRICAPICDGQYNLTNAPVVVDYPRAGLIHK